jgi:hypothetical protein
MTVKSSVMVILIKPCRVQHQINTKHSHSFETTFTECGIIAAFGLSNIGLYDWF